MRLSFYTTLLLAFTLLAMPANAQKKQNKNYKDFYKSANAHSNAPMVRTKKANADVILDTVSVAELDSVMKNMVGITDIVRGGKSILNPVVTLELDPQSSASKALFGCIESDYDRESIGRADVEPKGLAIPMLKKTSTANKSALAVNTPSQSAAGTAAKPATDTKSSGVNKVTTAKPVDSQGSSSRAFNDSDWKLFRAVDVKLMDQSDAAYLKKYAIVLGSFKTQNNADFIKRTFNGIGERAMVVKNDVGLYYALLGSYDSESEAIQKMEEITKKYTESMSKTRRLSRFGIPLDDLWILILK